MQKGQERLTLFHFCLMTNWSLFGEQVNAGHHYHIKVMSFLTGEGETAQLWTKIWSCPFLGLLGTWSATHAMGGKEGEMLKPLAVRGQARDEGERECSCSEMFFSIWHLSTLLFLCFKSFENQSRDFHVEGLGQFLFAQSLLMSWCCLEGMGKLPNIQTVL